MKLKHWTVGIRIHLFNRRATCTFCIFSLEIHQTFKETRFVLFCLVYMKKKKKTDNDNRNKQKKTLETFQTVCATRRLVCNLKYFVIWRMWYWTECGDPPVEYWRCQLQCLTTGSLSCFLRWHSHWIIQTKPQSAPQADLNNHRQ